MGYDHVDCIIDRSPAGMVYLNAQFDLNGFACIALNPKSACIRFVCNAGFKHSSI